MKTPKYALLITLCLTIALGAFAAEDKPLTLASQGSFFVGGEIKKIPAAGPAPAGDMTVNQMYVQYQAPLNSDRHQPVVMVH